MRSAIAEIAVNCGFSSQSHMTNLFKQRLGKTPLQIRQTVS
ncbi:MAG: AraC family transcriptional regulator [Limnoraphis sp. WC205]|nr:AraC family transcriptional regulator [Limnoraphis sp. WC205]